MNRPGKRPTRDADCLKGPLGFAGRRAERLARGIPDKLPPRLASLGRTTVHHDGRGPKGTRSPRTSTVELLVDVDSQERYVRYPGCAPEPMVKNSSQPDTVALIATRPMDSRGRWKPTGWGRQSGSGPRDEARPLFDD